MREPNLVIGGPNDEASQREWCSSQGIRVEHHCCLDMAFAISSPLFVPHQGPNETMLWIDSWNEYRLPVPKRGYTSTLIDYCPWCGAALAPSRRDEWYEKLYALGFNDPGEDDIPLEFQSDAWWRNPNLGEDSSPEHG
jgi:hypothetical protein